MTSCVMHLGVTKGAQGRYTTGAPNIVFMLLLILNLSVTYSTSELVGWNSLIKIIRLRVAKPIDLSVQVCFPTPTIQSVLLFFYGNHEFIILGPSIRDNNVYEGVPVVFCQIHYSQVWDTSCVVYKGGWIWKCCCAVVQIDVLKTQSETSIIDIHKQ